MRNCRGFRSRVDGWALLDLWIVHIKAGDGRRTTARHDTFIASQDSQNAQEQVDDVHVQRGCTVYRVVQRLGNLIGAAPVVADVAAEDQHHDPVENAMTDTEHQDFHQFHDDHQQQRDRQR